MRHFATHSERCCRLGVVVVVSFLVLLNGVVATATNKTSFRPGLYTFGGARTSFDDSSLAAVSQPAGQFQTIGPTTFVPTRGFVVAATNSFSGIVSKHPLGFNTSLELNITMLYEDYEPVGASGSTVYTPTLIIRVLASTSDEWSGTNINDLEPVAAVQIRQLRSSGASYVRATSAVPSASAECHKNTAPSVGGLRMVLASAADVMAVAWWRDAGANASADSALADVCNGYPSDNGWIAGPSQGTLANTSIYVAVGFETYYGTLPCACGLIRGRSRVNVNVNVNLRSNFALSLACDTRFVFVPSERGCLSARFYYFCPRQLHNFTFGNRSIATRRQRCWRHVIDNFGP